MVTQRCSGCGTVVPAGDGPWAWSCPNRRQGDDIDHVLVPFATSHATSDRVGVPDGPAPAAAGIIDVGSENPFVRYRRLLTPYALWREAGRDDLSYLELIEDLDAAVSRVAGTGFARTPLGSFPDMDRAVGAAVWVKDETGNVAGSHKGRHLFALAVHLRVLEALGRHSPAPLAIASCGNAARAAAVVAAAAGWPLQAFVPAEAEASETRGLAELGVEVIRCGRDGLAGDPSYRRFRQAVAEGAVPFSCQGPDNGSAIEGGSTLAWEVAEALGGRLDRIVVQVGGGALASAVGRGLERWGLRPVFDSVQSAGAHPLERAVRRLEAECPPEVSVSTDAAYVDRALNWAARHRSKFMWPWETTPASAATGILDDETYDWLAVARATLASKGAVVVASEDSLLEANRLARQATGIDVSVTGSAGLAGLLVLARRATVAPHSNVVVLFTG